MEVTWCHSALFHVPPQPSQRPNSALKLQRVVPGSWHPASRNPDGGGLFCYSITVTDWGIKSERSWNQDRASGETGRMVGRRGGLQSIRRAGETWLQAAHILARWFHFPHSAQRREGGRWDAPRRCSTQAQLKRVAQVWCNRWCTRLLVFEFALYSSTSSQPISLSRRHTCLARKLI